MEDSWPAIGNLIVLFLIICLHGVFAAAEFALVRSNPAKLKAPVRQRRKGTSASIWLLEHLDLSLATTQLATTLCTLLLGWLGILVASQLIMHSFGASSAAKDPIMLSSAAVGCALILLLFVHGVIGELFAKSLALRYPEHTLRFTSGTVFLCAQLFRPFILASNWVSSLLLRVFGTSVEDSLGRLHSFSELSMLVSESNEGEGIDKEEEEMIRGVVGFSETIAREVMTPRTDLVKLDIGASFEDVVNVVVDTGFSRFPVTDEGVDDIQGYVLGKDLLQYLAKDSASRRAGFSVREVLRKPYFIPGTKPIDDLLNEFKARKLHIAVVLDEHGGVDGVVTMEDLIEEIVGDIFDESDVLEHSVIVEDSGELVVDGGTLVSDLNERFSLDIPEGDYDTIAGFIFTSLGRMPQVGDTIDLSETGVHVNGVLSTGAFTEDAVYAEMNGIGPSAANSSADDAVRLGGSPHTAITVERVEGHRIERVRVCSYSKENNDETASDAAASEKKGEVSDEAP